MPPVTHRVYHGDCVEVMRGLPDRSIDAVICDPPYPEIDRKYGRWTEEEWWGLMMGVCTEVRRLLKPTGSAVFILQPNSRKVGSMRGWLWEFMAWCCREWNQIQDVWWWNVSTPPTVHCHRDIGLMRPSLKCAVWAGPETCYRNQDNVLIPTADSVLNDKRVNRMLLDRHPGGQSMRKGRCLETCKERGGSTPYNVGVFGNGDSQSSAGAHGHGAGTPLKLMQWWVRYISPPGSLVLDPFAGSGTLGIACMREGRRSVMIEKEEEYVRIIHKRLEDERRLQPSPGG